MPGTLEGEVALDGGLDDRHFLEIRAIGAAGLEAERLQLLGEILGGQLAARSRGRAPWNSSDDSALTWLVSDSTVISFSAGPAGLAAGGGAAGEQAVKNRKSAATKT